MNVLLERGANPNVALPNGTTALDIAISSGFVEATDILMSFAADVTRTLAMHSRKSGLAAKWFQETVPLLSAVEREDLSKVRELLSAGIGPNAQDKKGETALIRADRQGNDDIVQELIEFGADINGTAEGGWSPLSQAVVKGHISTIRYLVAHGADLTAKSRAGVSILDLAASTGRETVIKLIISTATEQGVSLDVRQAAEVAVRHGYEGVKSVLVQS